MEGVLWPDLGGRRVLLGVSGGVAAYKAAELCRLLARAGAEVSVMLTQAAERFVGSATFAALSGRAVATDLFDPVQEQQIGHIRLAERAELLIVAPATADLLGRFAAGLANDLVTTVHLAFRGPLLLAPAMNVHMWEHAATRANIACLHDRGARFVGPNSGEMACGHVGAGRMAEPEAILQAAGHCLSPQDFRGCRVLVSAGATREAIDPVRFISNRSSGKMGYALAAEAAARGAEVTLVSGPTCLPAPYGVTRVPVTSAAEMARELTSRFARQDVLIMAAAVADYRPMRVAAEKLKKETLGESHGLELERTADILAGLRDVTPAGAPAGVRPVVVGFAAETGPGALDRAPLKLFSKGCDLALVNDVSQPDAGFDVDTNRLLIHERERAAEVLPLLSKRRAAARVLDRLAALIEARRVQGA